MGSVLTDTSYGSGFAPWMAATWTKSDVLRYGENPHQKAAVYRIGRQPEGGVAQGVQLHGTEMSYNNFIDADAATRSAHDHGANPTVATPHRRPEAQSVKPTGARPRKHSRDS